MDRQLQNSLQNKWSDIFLTYLRGVLHLAQRTGKIRVSILIFEKLKLFTEPILICYPDNRIADSWKNDFEKFGFNNPNVIFTNTSSLKKYIGQKFKMFVIDEVHELSDNETMLCSVISNNSEYVLALSGTITPNTERHIKQSLGLNILISYTTDDAIKDNLIADYRITIHVVRLGIDKPKYKKLTYLIDKLKKSNKPYDNFIFERNRLLQKSLAKKEKLIELISKLKDKRVIIFTGLQEISESLNIPFYHSKSENEESFKNFIDGKIDQLALVNTGAVGATYKPLDSVVFSNFTYDSQKSEQTISRALLLDYRGKVADIHIITTDEFVELNKLKETLKYIQENKIKYV